MEKRIEPSTLMKALDTITSNGQCSYSHKTPLKDSSYERFTYNSHTIFDRQQCKGMVRVSGIFNRSFSCVIFFRAIQENHSDHFKLE